MTNSNQLAIEFLQELKANHGINEYVHALKMLNPQNLYDDLSTSNHQKAFWLNIYNAFLQMMLKENPLLYRERRKLFTQKSICIAQQQLSLDDIEHGILRNSSWKYGAGYIRKIIVSAFERKFRLKKIDERIHFALNCGAKSCPAIRFYQFDKLDEQLNLATEAYLEQEVNYNLEKKTFYISPLFLWYQGDFGGKKGVISFLQKYGYPIYDHIHLKYNLYDWELAISNYKT